MHAATAVLSAATDPQSDAMLVAVALETPAPDADARAHTKKGQPSRELIVHQVRLVAGAWRGARLDQPPQLAHVRATRRATRQKASGCTVEGPQLGDRAWLQVGLVAEHEES
jgi:hypothetical protein